MSGAIRPFAADRPFCIDSATHDRLVAMSLCHEVIRRGVPPPVLSFVQPEAFRTCHQCRAWSAVIRTVEAYAIACSTEQREAPGSISIFFFSLSSIPFFLSIRFFFSPSLFLFSL